VAAACLVNKAARRIEDRLAPLLDLVGINEYYGWYYPNPDDLLEIDAAYDLPGALVITESGADALSGLTGEESVLGSEACQVEYFRTKCAVLAQMRRLRGVIPWVLYDFRTLRRFNSRQGGFNRKGLIADDKTTRKRAFAVLQAFYAELAGRGR
jgi:beta-glucuronidase